MSHPAKFTDSILERAVEMLDERIDDERRPFLSVLDPFAGTGKGVDYLRSRGYDALGVDLEPPEAWGDQFVDAKPPSRFAAAEGPLVVQGNALDLDLDDNCIDVIFTSPTYGNRFADRDMRKSCAGTYMKGLQREASEGSSCHLQWGDKYRWFHTDAWIEARRVLRPGGYFLLNISDHYRDKVPVPVSAWHVGQLVHLGFEWLDAKAVPTPRMKNGANPTRCEVEWLHLFKKVSP